MTSPPNALTIAGIDPSGGAGIYADLKAFSALGAYGCGVVAALTAQNTRAVTGVHAPPIEFLRLQLDTLFEDVRIDAVKIGMLASAEIVSTVADRLAHYGADRVVVDPVMVAKSGDLLLAKSAVAMLRDVLLPRTFVVTPNLPEAGVLLGETAPDSVKTMFGAAERLRAMLPTDSERWVLLKGGHLPGHEVVDLLFDGDRMIEFRSPRIETKNTHGTGCTLSAAIAALLPKYASAEEAVREARAYLQEAMRAADELEVGSGHGPVHHFHAWWSRSSVS
ncbi:Hydroxymethylpyrimidine phosphate kinase ThiD [Labilithrix luteola]|uniref:hydroxymethylpyrimidine kinase n=1 Tax=Labilithrix luteola TaxID=1391654 RepID=A0A0K1PVH3_9BACT|nr:bifunctional hydroxymethylpyrimidine kinase/phosphomethylpyrimidine kinase [Labilithrix luteola]AKU97530.1 Hydroxymethylpyrimidine phosphate kinase ThiD [Labilithrix luteola]